MVSRTSWASTTSGASPRATSCRATKKATVPLSNATGVPGGGCCTLRSRSNPIRSDYARQIDPRQKGTDIFWFTTADELSLEDPRRVFFENIWITAADPNPGALF